MRSSKSSASAVGPTAASTPRWRRRKGDSPPPTKRGRGGWSNRWASSCRDRCSSAIRPARLRTLFARRGFSEMAATPSEPCPPGWMPARSSRAPGRRRPPGDRMLTVRGKKIEAEQIGPRDGPTLVLLHEGLGSVGLWRDFPRKLADATGLPVFAYSRANYGRSLPTAPLPRPVRYMHDEALLLPEVLSAAGISEAVLFGHSDGASIAIL